MNRKSNAILRVLMHGFFLTSLNLFSGSIAFLILKLSGSPITYVASGIIVVLTCLLVYYFIYNLMGRIQLWVMHIDSLLMGMAILVFSIGLQPALLHPLTSFFMESDHGSFAWLYELILPALVNTCCLLLNHFVLKSR